MRTREMEILNPSRQRAISMLTELRGRTSLRDFGEKIGKDSGYLHRVESGKVPASVDLIKSYASHGCKDPEEVDKTTFYICLLQGKKIPPVTNPEAEAIARFRQILRDIANQPKGV